MAFARNQDQRRSLRHPEGEQHPKGFAGAWEDPGVMPQPHFPTSLALSYSERAYLIFISPCLGKFKGCHVLPGMHSPSKNSSLLPHWKSHQISCCHGHRGHPQGAGSPWGPNCSRLLEAPRSHSLWMHILTQGEQRCQCCPGPSEVQGAQSLCPKNNDLCLEKQSSVKSLLSTFHCQKQQSWK